MFQRFILGMLASAAAFGLPSTPAHAGSFSISPLRAELAAAAQTASLTIRNQDATPVVVQAEGLLWEQVDGVDRLTPTRDVLVSPAVFTIPGNGSQLVRVALRRAVDPERELSYRLILTEVPQQARPDFVGLNVALRLSLPIFVAPAAAPSPQLEWSTVNAPDGAPLLAARNTGTAHARVLNFTATPADSDSADAATSVDAAAYILPGQSRTWPLAKNNNDGISSTDLHRLRVKGTTEAGDFEVEIGSGSP